MLRKNIFNLREQLLPYHLHLLKKWHNDDGVSIVRPLYLENPENAGVISYPGEYFFGDNFL